MTFQELVKTLKHAKRRKQVMQIDFWPRGGCLQCTAYGRIVEVTKEYVRVQGLTWDYGHEVRLDEIEKFRIVKEWRTTERVKKK